MKLDWPQAIVVVAVLGFCGVVAWKDPSQITNVLIPALGTLFSASRGAVAAKVEQ